MAAERGSAAAAMEARMTQMETDLATMRADMLTHARSLEEQKVALMDNLNLEFANHKILMGEIIEGARKEFADLKGGIKSLYDATDNALKVVMNKVQDIEHGKGGGGSGDGGDAGWKTKGYIPTKSMIPKTFTNQEEEWRQWQDDVTDYFDNVTNGMRKFLKEVELEAQPVTDTWLSERRTQFGDKVVDGQVQVWRALKHLTDGEARKVVNSVGSENGFRAWQKLHQRFGPSLSSKQGLALVELSGMVAKPAKNPAETRFLITELERRSRWWRM